MTTNDKIPRIRFKGFTDTWEQRKLNEITFYEASNYSSNSLNLSGENGKYPIFDANSFLGYLSVYDQDKPYISIIKDGAGVGRIEKRPAKSSVIGTMGYIKPYNSNIDFIGATLIKMNLNKYTSGSTIPHIYFRDYGKYECLVPVIKEQEKIGTLFSKLDNLITLHQRKYDKLLNVKKSLLEKMFPQGDETTPKIRFKGFTDAWEQRKLGDICHIITGGEAPNDNIKSLFPEGEYKYPIFSNGLGDNAIWGFSKSYTIDVPAITFSSIGTLGYPELRNPYFTPIIRLKVIIPKDKSANISYIKNALSISDFSNNASGIPNINSNAVKEIKITLTNSYMEQQKIGKLHNNLDNLITLHQRKLEKLKNIKSALLEKMFV